MRRPSISTEFFILVGTLLAVIGFLATSGVRVSQKVLDNTLNLRYSYIAQQEPLPRGDPFYAEHFTILETDQLAGAIRLVALELHRS